MRMLIPDCPPLIQEQIERLGQELDALLGSDLTGIYVHGSLALGGFNPERSDIDLLAVVQASLTAEAKRRIAEVLLRASGNPRPVEMTFVTTAALRAGGHPMPFEYHYSEMWRSQYEQELKSGEWHRWNDRTLRDPDLAGQIAVAVKQGITLCGEPGSRALPIPAAAHVRASFLEDCEGALDEIDTDPVYGVLNPLRTYAFLMTGRLLSKTEAGQWGQKILPPSLHPIVAQALAQYTREDSNLEDSPPDDTILAAFASYLREQIERLTPNATSG